MIVKILDSECLDLLKDRKTIEACLSKYQNHKNSDWVMGVCDKDPFINTKYDSLEDLEMDMSSASPQETDFENVKAFMKMIIIP